jgi:uncharacterized membrane protein HdeD (DUF308 family)
MTNDTPTPDPNRPETLDSPEVETATSTTEIPAAESPAAVSPGPDIPGPEAPAPEPPGADPAPASPSRQDTLGVIKQSTTWAILLGALMITLGFAAISLPLVTSLALTLWIGWLLVGNSAIKLVYAIQTRQEGSLWLKLLLAMLYLAAGVVLIVNPLEGILTLTLLLGSFLLAEGVVELLLALQMRSSQANWLWLLFNALLTLTLGVFIWAEWPLDAPWVVGMLVGISFIASGLSRIMVSLAVRSTVRQLAETT